MNANGWLARAVHLNNIKHNIYSISLVPQKLALPMALAPTVPSQRTEQELLETSFLTIGGYDRNDYSGNITWFDAIDSWN